MQLQVHREVTNDPNDDTLTAIYYRVQYYVSTHTHTVKSRCGSNGLESHGRLPVKTFIVKKVVVDPENLKGGKYIKYKPSRSAAIFL